MAYYPPEQAQLVHATVRWAAAAMFVVKSMVRPPSAPVAAGPAPAAAAAAARLIADLREELFGVLLPHELDWLLTQPHKPLALGQVRC